MGDIARPSLLVAVISVSSNSRIALADDGAADACRLSYGETVQPASTTAGLMDSTVRTPVAAPCSSISKSGAP